MKHLIIILLCTLGMANGSNKVLAQTEEVQQLLLNVEKLAQLKQILADMKKTYEILYTGYNQVKNLTEGNFTLHEGFLGDLLKVSPAVRNYRKVVGILQGQKQILQEGKRAIQRFQSDDHFEAGEIAYLQKVYSGLLVQSAANLDALALVVTSAELRMSDEERLAAIDNIYAQVEDQLAFLRHFTNQASLLGLQRMKEKNDIRALSKLYRVNQ